MPTEVYEKVTNDDGTESYQPVSWDKVELPEEVVKVNPVYKQVLDESVNRRKTIANLKKQLDEVAKTEGDEPETPQPQTPEDGLQFKTRAELLEFIRQETENRNNAEAQQKRAKEAKVTEIVNKHKLSSDAVPLLVSLDEAQAENIAQYIGQQKLRFDSTNGGAGENRQLSVDSIAAKVAGKLNLSDEK